MNFRFRELMGRQKTLCSWKDEVKNEDESQQNYYRQQILLIDFLIFRSSKVESFGKSFSFPLFATFFLFVPALLHSQRIPNFMQSVKFMFNYESAENKKFPFFRHSMNTLLFIWSQDAINIVQNGFFCNFALPRLDSRPTRQSLESALFSFSRASMT